jgi:hypothetical protein
MKGFRRKMAGPPNLDIEPPRAHLSTKELLRAESLATMLASSRASEIIEVADLLAGMYINSWERLSSFWPAPEAIESFLENVCQISPQRWHYWIEQYGESKRGTKDRLWRIPRLRPDLRRKGRPTRTKKFQWSLELQNIIKAAEQIAPYRDAAGGRELPILTTECVLLCVARNCDSEISHRLVATGLDLSQLEQAALHPKHAPLH